MKKDTNVVTDLDKKRKELQEFLYKVERKETKQTHLIKKCKIEIARLLTTINSKGEEVSES